MRSLRSSYSTEYRVVLTKWWYKVVVSGRPIVQSSTHKVGVDSGRPIVQSSTHKVGVV